MENSYTLYIPSEIWCMILKNKQLEKENEQLERKIKKIKKKCKRVKELENQLNSAYCKYCEQDIIQCFKCSKYCCECETQYNYCCENCNENYCAKCMTKCYQCRDYICYTCTIQFNNKSYCDVCIDNSDSDS